MIASFRVPRWAVVSAILAPVGMIGRWILAAAIQPSFDPMPERISALAASSATAPEVMTAGLALTGLAYMVTAADLRPARGVGRVVLGVGGLATVVVAMTPVDASPRVPRGGRPRHQRVPGAARQAAERGLTERSAR